MNTDPIADFLTRMRNAVKAKHSEVAIPHSKMKEAIAKILADNKFVKAYRSADNDGKKTLYVEFLPEKTRLNLKRISKPGQRIYKALPEIRRVRNGYGIGIYSTNTGIMTDKEARKQKCGGELICEIY